MDLEQKLANIRLLALDVDGVLTDGKITYTTHPDTGLIYETKSFNAKDGQGLNLLHRVGIKTAIITARSSAINQHRAHELSIDYICQNVKQKLNQLTDIATELGIDFSQIAYMGDDLPDLKPLQAVGLPCCPVDAVEEIKAQCLFVSRYTGGNGAVRELSDCLLRVQGKHPIG